MSAVTTTIRQRFDAPAKAWLTTDGSREVLAWFAIELEVRCHVDEVGEMYRRVFESVGLRDGWDVTVHGVVLRVFGWALGGMADAESIAGGVERAIRQAAKSAPLVGNGKGPTFKQLMNKLHVKERGLAAPTETVLRMEG